MLGGKARLDEKLVVPLVSETGKNAGQDRIDASHKASASRDELPKHSAGSLKVSQRGYVEVRTELTVGRDRLRAHQVTDAWVSGSTTRFVSLCFRQGRRNRDIACDERADRADSGVARRIERIEPLWAATTGASTVTNSRSSGLRVAGPEGGLNRPSKSAKADMYAGVFISVATLSFHSAVRFLVSVHVGHQRRA